MENGDKYQTIPCPRCGEQILKRTINQHRETCQRVPLAAELCELLDQDPGLSIRALAIRFRCSYQFLQRRLRASRWDRDRLRRRGQQAKSLSLKSRNRSSVAEPQCRRCLILLSKTDGLVKETPTGPLCFHCVYELRQIAQRLSRRRAAWLNRTDRELLRRYDRQWRSLLWS